MHIWKVEEDGCRSYSLRGKGAKKERKEACKTFISGSGAIADKLVWQSALEPGKSDLSTRVTTI